MGARLRSGTEWFGIIYFVQQAPPRKALISYKVRPAYLGGGVICPPSEIG